MKKDWIQSVENVAVCILVVAFALLVACYIMQQLFNADIVILATVAVGLITIFVILIVIATIAMLVLYIIAVFTGTKK